MKKTLGWVMAVVVMIGSPALARDLARVNGATITDADLKNALSGFTPAQRRKILKDQTAKGQVVEDLINQELLVQQAQKLRLDQSKEYKKALEAFRKQYLANYIVEKNLSGQMTEDAAKKHYRRHRDHYSTDQVHAMHILVNDAKTASKVLGEAKKKDADFNKLALKYSKDPSVSNNRGNLGWFTRDRMVPEFTNPVFEAKEGTVIGPIKTAYGFHVVKVMEKRIGKPLNYEEVELRVKNDLRRQLVDRYIAQLRNKAKINKE